MDLDVFNGDMSALISDFIISIHDVDAGDASAAITSAELIVTEELGAQGHSVDRLLQIKLWLAAHFFELSWNQGGLVSKQVGDSKEEYNRLSATKTGFASTRYGAQAMAFDTSGILASIASSNQRSEFRVI